MDDSTQSGYFLYHSIGMYPGKEPDLTRAMAAFARVWATRNDGQWGYVLGHRQGFIDHWQRLLNAAPGTVTTCDSVTDGLHRYMRALPEGALRDKRVLIAADCFPSLHFLLTGLAPKMGFALDTVPLRDGLWVHEDDFLEHWGRDVGLALITWVTSTASARVDLTRLTQHGRTMGSRIGLDITQAAGLIPVDVTELGVDLALSTSLKWMCGTPGAGALYVAQPGDLIPEGRGWFSQPDPFSWDLDSFAFAPDSRRLDGGTPGSMAAIASLPALEWHAAQDHAAIYQRNQRLCDQIIAQADALDLPLASPRDQAKRGGSVMLRLPQDPAALLDSLRNAGFAADARGPILRLSPGVMTDEDSIGPLFELIANSLRK